MNLRLLGTGAADGIPGFFSDDPVSGYARKVGGKETRTRTGALLDGIIKIDLPPDTYMQMLRDHVDFADWTALIFTHSDDDHLITAELQYAVIPFTQRDHLPFTVYANPTVCSLIHARYPDWPIELQETHSFVAFDHGPYRITPIRARHIDEEDCHNLIFERGGKTLLYGTDTGIWSEETFDFLQRFQLDLLVIECTDGDQPSTYHGHLNIDSCRGVVDRLRTQGTVRSDTRIVTTHHSWRGGLSHYQLEQRLAPFGIEPGYDGMILEV